MRCWSVKPNLQNRLVIKYLQCRKSLDDIPVGQCDEVDNFSSLQGNEPSVLFRVGGVVSLDRIPS